MPNEKVDPQVVDGVTMTNTKTIAEGAAVATNMLYQVLGQAVGLAAQNAVTNQQNMNAIGQAATTAAIDRLLHTQPIDAVAQQKLLSGSDLGQQMLNLLSALSSGQQGVKVAQSTPPETAQPTT